MIKTYDRIFSIVNRIPRGRVATYGQIAELAGVPGAARQVGYALSALSNNPKKVAWHRVVNAQGEISLRSQPGRENIQRVLLEKEGVVFSKSSRISLEKFRWKTDSSLRIEFID